MGAGGSTIALTWHLMRARPAATARGSSSPTARRPGSTTSAGSMRAMGADVPVDYVLSHEPGRQRPVLATAAAGRLVVNATGLGKDAPGLAADRRRRSSRSGRWPGS